MARPTPPPAAPEPAAPPQPQPKGVDLERVVNAQAQALGNMQTQLLMRDIYIGDLEAELTALKGDAPAATGD